MRRATAREGGNSPQLIVGRYKTKRETMKIKVGDTVYDGELVPVMVILSDDDKRNIAGMLPGCAKYAAFPNGSPQAEIERWMADLPPNKEITEPESEQ
jgi:hypothetical protein